MINYRIVRRSALLLLTLFVTACGATVREIIPTDRPTVTATYTETPTRTPGFNATPSPAPTSLAAQVTGGPSPTSLFGATSTAAAVLPTSTRVVNPNAPRIEFFTSDVLAVSPGDAVTLFWSTRGTTGATIYRLDQTGERNQLWNVAPDGSLSVPTRRADRGQVSFVLSVGEGALLTEESLSIPLSCPDPWFFQPAPDECPRGPAQPSRLIEESFERGRMMYIESSNRVYVLFNDALEPAWVSFENRYDPAIHPELETSFVPPPGLVQPLRILGFIWRGNDVVRNRLGLATGDESDYDGFTQTVAAGDTTETLYINSADGSVLRLLPGGTAWQIITRQ